MPGPRLELNWVDVGVILSNALDNAIEGCLQNAPEHRAVEVEISCNGRMLMLSVSNPFFGTLVKKKDGLFETSKMDKANHGLGLRGIQRLVNSNCGELDIQTEHNRFVLSVILPEQKK